jgi:hypothetical protein
MGRSKAHTVISSRAIEDALLLRGTRDLADLEASPIYR